MVAENTIATDKPKILGLEWDSNADAMSFPFLKVVSETKALHGQLTKRNVLSIVAKVFDPLGLLEPFTFKLKPKLGHMETTLWSDSEIVLDWLCSKKLPDSFVSKRIEEIKKLHLTLLIF